MVKQIYIGSDHGGFHQKNKIKRYLDEKRRKFSDEGTYTEDLCDFPFYAKEVSSQVIKNNGVGILICTSGIGMSIAANKVKGIRAALVDSVENAIIARKHNDANILCLSSKTPIARVKQILDAFLKTKPSSVKRYHRRNEMLEH